MSVLLSRHRGGRATAVLTMLLAAAGPIVATDAAAATRDPAGAQQTRKKQAPEDQRVTETVTVTATRLPARIADMPTAIKVWSGENLQQLPAMVLDDALRWSPSVSLFRRTSSRAAHPTSQGLNLRGLAPSGVSRALVLVDGIPINDPFGGWIYWDRVPLLAIERIEVAKGGGSAPYGSQALAGVVQLDTRRANRTSVQLQVLSGEDSTSRFGLAVGTARPSFSVLATAEAFHTGGYVATAPAARGSVDTTVTSTHQAARLRFDLPGSATIVLEGLRERRSNGTPLQDNLTRVGGASGRWRGTTEQGFGGWNLHAFARSQRFESTFSRIGPGRNSEALVLEQRVPSTDLGAGGLAWMELGEHATVSAGGDWRRVAGHSKERVVVIGRRRAPGGRQYLGGGFSSLNWAPSSRWSVDLSLRADGWHQTPVDTPGEARSAFTLSPRGGFVFHPTDTTTLRASGYSAFRAPTLNELYRQFRVGNTLTQANPDLDQESLHGAEAGGSWTGRLGSGGSARLTLESTFYWNRLEDAVVNATQSVTPSLIRRKRQNLGDATVKGLELEGRLQLGRAWTVSTALTLMSAHFRGGEASAPGNQPTPESAAKAAIAGKRLPQVPDYRARSTIGYLTPSGWNVLASVSATGVQFEDDLNLFPLASAVTIDAGAQIPLRSGLQLTLRGENLLDHGVPVKRTPTLTLGPPRLIYGGIAINWPSGQR
ncbi:MAG: TonB-dependent receptor [Acidobacteriota bacterium]